MVSYSSCISVPVLDVQLHYWSPAAAADMPAVLEAAVSLCAPVQAVVKLHSLDNPAETNNVV